MQVTGVLKTIKETATYGTSGFRKREIVVTTTEQYPQPLLIEFVQDKCDLLNAFSEGENAIIDVNLRGREWINPQGEAVYFNSIQGWRISKANANNEPATPLDNIPPKNTTNNAEPDDDLPF